MKILIEVGKWLGLYVFCVVTCIVSFLLLATAQSNIGVIAGFILIVMGLFFSAIIVKSISRNYKSKFKFILIIFPIAVLFFLLIKIVDIIFYDPNMTLDIPNLENIKL